MRKLLLILGLAISMQSQSQVKVITTVAGNGTPGFSGDNGPATSAQIEGGLGIYVDSHNDIYFSAGTRIRKITAATGIITTIAGTGVHGYSGDNGPATAAQLHVPYGVYVDAAGNVYICTTGDSRVRKINTSGIITTFAGNGTGGYSGDGGLATAAQLNIPGNVTGDAAGNIYISDYGNMTIRKVNTSGIISTIAGTGVFGYSGNGGNALSANLASPTSIKFDAAGNYYISENNPNGIRKVNLSNIISAVAGNGNAATGNTGDGGPATAALFCDIEGAAVDPAGNVYIADLCNHTVRKVDVTTGNISIYAGTGGTGFTGDNGPATGATFGGPWTVCYANNTLYVTDNGNSRIRKISDVYTFNGNGDWDLASNWVGNAIAPKNIPIGATVVIDHVPGGTCDVTGNVNVQQFASLSIQAGKKINIINGDLTNEGTISGGGYIYMSGVLSGLSSPGLLTDTMVLNNKQLFLTGNTNATCIIMNGGSKIRLDDYNLNMVTNDIFGSSSSYVITNGLGSLKQPSQTFAVSYPIGPSSTVYAPAAISNAGTPDKIAVRVVTGVLTASRPAIPSPDPDGNVNMTWFISEETVGGSNANITLQWRGIDEQPGFNREASYIAHLLSCPPPPPPNCDAGFYDAVAPSVAAGGELYSQSRGEVTSFNTTTFIVTSQDDVYKFINTYGTTPGDGNWSNPLNWTNVRVPPSTIRAGMEVIIDPVSGQCNFTGNLIVEPGGKLTIKPGKIFKVIQ